MGAELPFFCAPPGAERCILPTWAVGERHVRKQRVARSSKAKTAFGKPK